MTDYPEDIMKTAETEAASWYGGNEPNAASFLGVKMRFAAAIMTERNRCLNVCAAEREWGDFHPDDVMTRIETGSGPRQIQGWNCEYEDD